MSLPLIKYNAKMGVKKSRRGKASDLNRDHSHQEYIDASQGSLMSKRSYSKALSSQPSSKSPRHIYLSQFPDFLHDYIEDIIDVKANGKYGFRVIGDLIRQCEDSWSLVIM
ncbi:unnamed protein product [Lathyrus oleraceus]